MALCESRFRLHCAIWVNCSQEETFGNLLSRLEEDKFSESRVERVNIEDNIKHRHEVQLDAPVSLCSHEQFNC